MYTIASCVFTPNDDIPYSAHGDPTSLEASRSSSALPLRTPSHLIVMFGDWFRVYDPTCIPFLDAPLRSFDDNYDNVFPMCVEHARLLIVSY